MKFAGIIGLLIFFTATLHAQDITGIWRGYFYSGYGIMRQQYKYEVQINQLDSKKGPGGANPIKGVTYSYRLVSFYGKARLVGIYNKQTKEMTLKEDTLLEVKMDGDGFSCLMTCYLEYHKEGDKELLEGSFSSVVTKNGADCGAGSVRLERVEESDFRKEDFLLKKKSKQQALAISPPKPQTHKPAAEPPVITQNNTPPKKDQPVAKTSTPKKPVVINNSKVKRPADNSTKPLPAKTDSAIVKTTPVLPPAIVAPPVEAPLKPLPPVPDVIKQRDNPLVRTLVTNSPDILIELYDNGEVDGDTITVYHNNEVVAFKRGLSTKPITINIKASTSDPHHEFVMVADNLGSIPPNTALMVVRTGGKRYELFISSNEEKNAKVVIDYKQPGSDLK